jgi:hypothetical protein
MKSTVANKKSKTLSSVLGDISFRTCKIRLRASQFMIHHAIITAKTEWYNRVPERRRCSAMLWLSNASSGFSLAVTSGQDQQLA